MTDAVLNLNTPAVKYGGDPPHIAIAVERDGDEVRISVKDDGVGIEKTEHQRIFQKFYRIDDRLAREREGSGLGLAIVNHVMRAHRGWVEVQSAPGKGSTFTLVVPLLREASRAEVEVLP
jgi:signal transduction histidine kinase